MDQRLSNWKAKTLSFAGHLTLTKSVIQALPAYVMQAAYIPRHLCEDIDKRCRRFLWGDSDESRHLHSVSWEKICKPKAWGGLGLRTAKNINQASLIKVGFHVTTRREDLWMEVVRSKYKCGKDIIPSISRDRPGSNLWRGLVYVGEGVQNNTIWKVGKGNFTNCWEHIWIPELGSLLIEPNPLFLRWRRT